MAAPQHPSHPWAQLFHTKHEAQRNKTARSTFAGSTSVAALSSAPFLRPASRKFDCLHHPSEPTTSEPENTHPSMVHGKQPQVQNMTSHKVALQCSRCQQLKQPRTRSQTRTTEPRLLILNNRTNQGFARC